jgi:hypothetical protein
MSALVPAPAGGHGFLHQQGEQFVFDDSTVVKFWGMDASIGATAAIQEQQAKFYAKNGVNLLRYHPIESFIGVLQKDSSGNRVLDPTRLDAFDKWFATLKTHGIYMTWSSFYPHVITTDDGYPTNLYNELPASGAGKSTSGMVNFMPQLQAAEWTWLQTLLTHTNPYTGLRYVDDPALAIVETHNEDCVFWFAPLNDLATGTKYPLHTAQMKQQWMTWLAAKYGTDAALKAAWGSGWRTGDSITNPNMGIYGAWEMTATGPAQNSHEKARMGDFIEYLAQTQEGYYAQRNSQLRALGYKAVTVSTAWMAGGPAAAAANLWADDAMSAIDRHAYSGGGAGSWQITTGAVNDTTALANPGTGILASGLFQVEDKPFIMTEWDQSPPNQWKAEMAPLFAFYGMGLQGWDASHHFAASMPRMGGGWPNMYSYVTETPAYMGQFPALAFAVAKGHVTEGPLVAARRFSLAEIFQGVDAFASPPTPNEALAVGRVTAKVADGLDASIAEDLDGGWDQTDKVIHSATGELTWDYGNKVVTLGAAKTEAIVGFAGGGTFDLPGVTVNITTPFVSLIFTPLDDVPLVSSTRILITAIARDQQTGAVYGADGGTLTAVGGPPLLLEPVQASITFKGAPIASAIVVDMYGVPQAEPVEQNGNTIQIDGRYATYYYEVTRAVPDAGPAAADGGASDAGTSSEGGSDAGEGRVRVRKGCGCNGISAGAFAWGVLLAGLMRRHGRRREVPLSSA